MGIERYTRNAVAGIGLLTASAGFACSADTGLENPVEFTPISAESTPSIASPMATSRPTELPTPTPLPEIKLPVFFKPTAITAESIPSFMKGVPIAEAQLDENGQWEDPGPGLVQHEAFHNQTLMWGHSRWQGVTQISGDFMLQGKPGDEVVIGGKQEIEKLTGPRDNENEDIEGTTYTITKFMVMDETHIDDLYHKDQKPERPTIFFFTSLRVDRQYDPSRYWVLPQAQIFEKAGKHVLTDLSDPDKYGYVVAVLEMKDGEECKVIKSYGDIDIPGFMTPNEQCD